MLRRFLSVVFLKRIFAVGTGFFSVYRKAWGWGKGTGQGGQCWTRTSDLRDVNAAL
jgi:hypothetical protein